MCKVLTLSSVHLHVLSVLAYIPKPVTNTVILRDSSRELKKGGPQKICLCPKLQNLKVTSFGKSLYR